MVSKFLKKRYFIISEFVDNGLMCQKINIFSIVIYVVFSGTFVYLLLISWFMRINTLKTKAIKKSIKP